MAHHKVPSPTVGTLTHSGSRAAARPLCDRPLASDHPALMPCHFPITLPAMKVLSARGVIRGAKAKSLFIAPVTRRRRPCIIACQPARATASPRPGAPAQQADAVHVGGVEERRLRGTGAKRAQAHIAAAQLFGHRLGERQDIGLAGVVDGHAGAGHEGGGEATLRMRPPPAPCMCGMARFVRQVSAVMLTLMVESRAPSLRRCRRPRAAQARVVHEDVDTAVAAGLVPQALGLGEVGQVGGDHGDLPGAVAQHIGQGGEFVLATGRSGSGCAPPRRRGARIPRRAPRRHR